MTWTHFWDMHSGGGQKLDWAHIYIEAPEAEARLVFYNRFGRNPGKVTCTCCGDDYSVSEYETLAEATAYQRHLVAITPEWAVDWKSLTHEQRVASNQLARHLEPDEEMPEGYVQSQWSPSRYHDPVTLDAYVAQEDVEVVHAADITPEQRVGTVPDQGYVWVDG